MKLNLNLILVAFLISGNLIAVSQTDPGTDNLAHQWTFDDGTANDNVQINPVNGKLEGNATIVNKALILLGQGQYLSFVGTTLALNTYPAISQEIWFTSVSAANTGYTMLTYFGNSSGGLGYNYLSVSAARGDDVSRTAISNGTYDSEIAANSPEYDDGKLHQMISIISADSVILYIDGELVSKTKNTIPLNTIGTALAYLGKGGYTNDPTWIGSISKYSIYNKSLTASEAEFLFQQGAEQSTMISASKATLSFDEFYHSETITVTATNLTDSIVISSPQGITVSSLLLAPNSINASVIVNYDGLTTVDGNIEFKSGDAILNIQVKSYSNDCFTKIYPTVTNLVSNPYVSSLSYFSGWGSQSINSDAAFVYCGATSGMVTGYNAGSLDVTLTGKLIPNTIYRIKAEVYTIGGNFQIGVFGWSNDQPDYTKSVSTNSSWQTIDFTFTTGAILANAQGIFFNNYGLSGTTGYIDNWEMYAIPKIYTSTSIVSFPAVGSKKIAVRAVNLSQEITITSPTGFNVVPNILSQGVNGDSITITFNGDSTTDGYIYFSSGSIIDSIYVNGSVNPTLVISALELLVDEINNTTSFTVTGHNLTNEITFNSPAGITVNPSILPQNASNSNVTLTYDGIGNSSGTIIVTSGSVSETISLLASRNDDCFTPLYQDATNLITDPTCNFNIEDGWGNQSINSDPAFVFCGSRSGKITNKGSFNRNLNGVLKPATEYRVRAMVYKESLVKGQNMGNVTYTLAMDSASNSTHYNLIKEAMDSACSYYSKYTPFIENIYVYYSSGIPTAQASYHGSIGFGSDTRYMWVGTAIHEMAHYFGSGTSDAWHSLMVNGVWTGTETNKLIASINGEEIHGDAQHYWPYGINQKEEITGLGSQEVQAQALADAVKIVKAMLVDDSGLPTNNPPVGIGLYGWDASSEDIYHEITIANSWQEVDFTFTTGNSLNTDQGIYFNEGSGYIDNWELYEIPLLSVAEPQEIIEPLVYIQQNNLVLEFEQIKNSTMSISIFDLQGKLLYQTIKFCEIGKNKTIIPVMLPSGMYLVRLTNGESSNSLKVINR